MNGHTAVIELRSPPIDGKPPERQSSKWTLSIVDKDMDTIAASANSAALAGSFCVVVSETRSFHQNVSVSILARWYDRNFIHRAFLIALLRQPSSLSRPSRLRGGLCFPQHDRSRSWGGLN